VSAFDDEFGLFGESDEAERRSTLGARKIATDDKYAEEFEPEEEVRKRPPPARMKAPRTRAAANPEVAQQRAADLLEFLAKKLVTKPEAVVLERFPAEDGEPPVIELAVDHEDLGKVIGRSGRVASALRTIVRATAEGRMSVEIFDTEEFYDTEEEGEEDAAE
jgi:predicted RNA-binding protein YlqC (UPF0109 family)